MLDQLGGRAAFDDLISAVLTAGELALAMQRDGAGQRAQKKPDRTPVTAADRAVEEQLARFVRTRFPSARLLGEEFGGDNEAGAGLRFLVDPIDGTRAFMRGLPTWSVLVGVEYDGRPIAGVAFLPAAGDLYTAVLGHGAYVNGRPVRLSAIERLADALVCHGGLAQFTDDGRGQALLGLAQQSYTQRGLGDFANYGALLQGQADAVVDPAIQPYDVAVAAVMVREAGGRFSSFDGADTIYGPGALASNGQPLHDELLTLLQAR